jgi:hypothetical protein
MEKKLIMKSNFKMMMIKTRINWKAKRIPNNLVRMKKMSNNQKINKKKARKEGVDTT